MADETCTCTTLPTGIHYPACPASPYQAGIRSGRSQERSSIVTWLRRGGATGSREPCNAELMYADKIERGEHLRPRTRETP